MTTPEQREEIRRRYAADGVSQSQLARNLGVTLKQVQYALRTEEMKAEALYRYRQQDAVAREKKLKREAEWRAQNPIEFRRSQRKSDRKRRIFSSAKRKQVSKAQYGKRKRAPGSISCDDVGHVMSNPCAYCGGPGEHLEHCTPLSRGGWNVAENCVAACAQCNRRKGSRTVLEFLRLWPKK